MKTFLVSCIIAMVSAGIYGTIDLAKDIKQGTLIQYEKEDAPTVKSFTAAEKNLLQAVNIKIKKEKNISQSSTPKIADLKIEYFSRGEPIQYSALELLEVDSAKKIADRAIVVPTETMTTLKADSNNAITIRRKKRQKVQYKIVFSWPPP